MDPLYKIIITQKFLQLESFVMEDMDDHQDTIDRYERLVREYPTLSVHGPVHYHVDNPSRFYFLQDYRDFINSGDLFLQRIKPLLDDVKAGRDGPCRYRDNRVETYRSFLSEYENSRFAEYRKFNPFR